LLWAYAAAVPASNINETTKHSMRLFIRLLLTGDVMTR
jgi:hypothetical protein